MRWTWRGTGCPAIATDARRALIPALAALLLLIASHGFAQPVEDESVRWLAYDVKLEPDLDAKTLRGRTTVRFRFAKGHAPPRSLALEAGSLVIDSVRVDGVTVRYSKAGEAVSVDLSGRLHTSSDRVVHELDFYFHGAPRSGIEFHPERGEVYTIFSSSQWMVCKDAPDVRATIRLEVSLPAGSVAVGSGELVSVRKTSDGKVVYTWNEPRAIPSFLYGFAAGRYLTATVRGRGFALELLSEDREPDELRKIFADSADMMAFFEAKSGVPFRGTYAQALVARTAGQEASRYAVLSEAYGKRVLEGQDSNPAHEALIAHEMAHQWWGLLVTNQSWGDFWLNEGFAVFMSGAYLEHRFGSDVYSELVSAWQKKAEDLGARGKDHPLVYGSWSHPTADDRAVVYQRGALVLHELRRRMGEAPFWEAIRRYTRQYAGRSVTTRDFQEAMEQASGQDLRDFFAKRVYGAERLE